MRTVVTYECEICLEEYGTEAEAMACESQGLPEPMAFLPGQAIPSFGESGVLFTTIQRVYVRNAYGKHEWWVSVNPYVNVSHNLSGSVIPATVFDPRWGWDFLRYGGTEEDLALWERTLQDYGFQEADVNQYMALSVRKVRQKVRPMPTPVQPKEFLVHDDFVSLDVFEQHVADAIARVKPLTPEHVATARADGGEQEVSGGVDREPIDGE